MVSWSKEKELIYFIGKPILMDNIQKMVTDIIANAEDIL